MKIYVVEVLNVRSKKCLPTFIFIQNKILSGYFRYLCKIRISRGSPNPISFLWRRTTSLLLFVLFGCAKKGHTLARKYTKSTQLSCLVFCTLEFVSSIEGSPVIRSETYLKQKRTKWLTINSSRIYPVNFNEQKQMSSEQSLNSVEMKCKLFVFNLIKLIHLTRRNHADS